MHNPSSQTTPTPANHWTPDRIHAQAERMRQINATRQAHNTTAESSAAILDRLTRNLIHFPEQLELFAEA